MEFAEGRNIVAVPEREPRLPVEAGSEIRVCWWRLGGEWEDQAHRLRSCLLGEKVRMYGCDATSAFSAGD